MDTVCIAVVGAGVIGLSTAACISQLVPGCTVTVISDRFTPDTTSNVAAGMLIPHTYAGERRYICKMLISHRPPIGMSDPEDGLVSPSHLRVPPNTDLHSLCG